MTTAAPHVDQRALRRSLDRAADTYDDHAVLQAEVCDSLVERLAFVRLAPNTVAELGCRTGRGAQALAVRYPGATVLALDVSPGMLRRVGASGPLRAVSSVTRLPLPDASVDLLFSNLALPWCDDLDAAFCEWRRVLRPNGLVHFTTLGPGTLRELRSAAGNPGHAHAFTDMHDLGDGLLRAGLAEPVLDVQRYTLTYRDVAALLRDLRSVGARNVSMLRPRTLTGRGRLLAMTTAYERLRSDGVLPASVEVVFGQAWGPAGAPHREQRRGEFTVDAARIGRRQRP